MLCFLDCSVTQRLIYRDVFRFIELPFKRVCSMQPLRSATVVRLKGSSMMNIIRCFTHSILRPCSSSSAPKHTRFNTDRLTILGETYEVDSCTNVTPRVTSKIGLHLHNRRNHPINLVRQRIQNYFYANYTNRAGNPLFAVFDNISPVVTSRQNFDSLLVPADHPSRSASDTYYINSKYVYFVNH